MEKTYFQPTSGQKTPQIEPKRETIKFLLSFSQALSVSRTNNLEFEALLN